MDKLHYYDQIVSILVTKMRYSDENNIVSLGNFNAKNENHLCIFYAAKIVHDIFGKTITIDLNPIQFLLFKWKHRLKQGIRRHKGSVMIDCPTLVQAIDKANTPNILAEIYQTYYKR